MAVRAVCVWLCVCVCNLQLSDSKQGVCVCAQQAKHVPPGRSDAIHPSDAGSETARAHPQRAPLRRTPQSRAAQNRPGLRVQGKQKDKQGERMQ